MIRSRLFLAAAFLLAALAPRADALPKQLFVSAQNGNDQSVCIFEFPCRTIAGALSSAPPGAELILVDSGEYGTFTLDRGMKIEAAPGVHASIFMSGSALTAISIAVQPEETVTLRGLTIYGALGTAISWTGAGTLRIEDCTIDGEGTGIGLKFFGAGQLFMHDTRIRGVQMGAYLYPRTAGAVTATFTRCRIEGTTLQGLIISDNVTGTATGCLLSGGKDTEAILVQGTLNGLKAAFDVVGCTLTSTKVAVSCKGTNGGQATVRVSGSTVTGNTQGFVQSGNSTFQSLGNNTLAGNGTDKTGTITVISGS